MYDFDRRIENTLFPNLPSSWQEFVRQEAYRLRLSHQELREISQIGVDLMMWQEASLPELWRGENKKKI